MLPLVGIYTSCVCLLTLNDTQYLMTKQLCYAQDVCQYLTMILQKKRRHLFVWYTTDFVVAGKILFNSHFSCGGGG